jgi:pimeloyl-ACP methyl ester carboxylesterase
VSLPSDLPVGRVLPLPGRGETFFRHVHGPPGAPVVLLLHGWTATADLQWWPVLERLGRTATVVAPDHRGHGRGIRAPFTIEDAADDAAALVVALGTGPVVASGYSMGGPIALTLARRHPHLVSALVLQATALEFHDRWADRVRWAARGLLEPMLRSRAGAKLAQRGLRAASGASPATAERMDWLAGELRRADPKAMVEAARALHAFDARPWAASLGLPAAALVTTRDRVVRPRRQRALAEAVRAEVVEVHDDHFAPWFQPDAFAAANERLVASVCARVAAPAVAGAGAAR